MSDIKDETIAELTRKAEIEKLRADTAEKKAILESKTVNNRLQTVEQNEKELDLAKKASYGALSKEEIQQIVADNEEYMEAARNPMMFICNSFNDIVPFFRKNMILVAAKTGEGKSTAVANIAYSCLIGKDPKTGKSLRTLVITNEEKREDFYNRITALHKGWHYTNHSRFTMEQRKEFSRMIPILSSSGRITVIDNNHGGSHGVTTTIEGIEALFASLIANKEYYDVVLVDYYQNIIGSKLNPTMDQYKVQERFSRAVDNFKNNYPAPIVVMSQLKSQGEKDKDAPFQIRIMGSKSIMVPCTFAVEMVVDRKNLRTKWIVHKSRYTEAMGKDFFTGYEKGRFIEYSSAFAEKVQRMALDRAAKKQEAIIDQKPENSLEEDQNKETK